MKDNTVEVQKMQLQKTCKRYKNKKKNTENKRE